MDRHHKQAGAKARKSPRTVIRLMLEVPISTPKVALRAESGLTSMKHRVWMEKLRLVLALKKTSCVQRLAKQGYM